MPQRTPNTLLTNAVPRRTPKDLVKNRVEGHIERSAATDTKGFGKRSAATDTKEVKRSAATDTKGLNGHIVGNPNLLTPSVNATVKQQ